MTRAQARLPWRLRRATGAEDLRRLARLRLPRVLFDSIDGGAGAETTLRANRAAFDSIALRPRQAAPPAAVELGLSLLGERLSLPVLLAPCGSTRIVCPDGERATARAAATAGTAYVVPHLGGTDAAAVRAAVDGALWYQVYQFGGPTVLDPALARAWAAGYRVLVATVDNARSLRGRDVANGMDLLVGGRGPRTWLPKARLLAAPRWLSGYLRDGAVLDCPNALRDGRPMSATEIATAGRLPASYFSWEDLARLRRDWTGKLIVKGIMTPEDARRAAAFGADAIIVSNHGGRSVDGLDATIRVLPGIAAAVPDLAVLLDGGVRCGGDVIRALCLGARAVLIGRPYMFALAYGEAGVTRLLDLLRDDLERTLAGLGCPSIAALGRDFVRVPTDWSAADAG